MKRIVAAIALALACSAAVAQETPVQALEKHLLGRLVTQFQLAPGLELDADLRSALEAMRSQHLARMRGVVRDWIATEVAALREQATPERLRRQLDARSANEAAMWQADSAGPEFDEAMQSAVLQPRWCRLAYNRHAFAAVALQLQGLPARERAIALEGEKRLLERWGRERSELRTADTLAHFEDGLVARLRAGDAVNAPAMPLGLAAYLLAQPPKPLTANYRCLLHRWGLEAMIAAGTPREQAWAAYLRANATSAVDWLGMPKLEADADYPKFARYYGVEGTITVEVLADAQGHAASAMIVERSVTVPGVRDVRPIAFEGVFDDESVARALRATLEPSERRRLEIAWSLR